MCLFSYSVNLIEVYCMLISRLKQLVVVHLQVCAVFIHLEIKRVVFDLSLNHGWDVLFVQDALLLLGVLRFQFDY